MKSKKRASTVGVRELKNHLSATLEDVRNGSMVTITDRQEPVALMVPIGSANRETTLQRFIATGRIRWGGGKPKGIGKSRRLKGAPLADAVIEDRR